ncbi:DUF4296 domain-containing protein [uncultured Algibacter sp.]|uniref:DUF4296 domain-containing protein n=1 Tax=uncultured Algibacter sp. TaxID=298659 RepID=UPI00261CD5E5|nr:DUF4296 domain-containing protein [uncultured Algibacter sp.]
MILKRFTILLAVLVIASSCYNLKGPKKPKNLISKEQMINILIDIRLLSSATGANKKVLDNHNIIPEAYIYKKYKIDSLQFNLSNNYYAYHVEDYDDIYAKIQDSLKYLKEFFTELEKKELKEQKEKDSIKALMVKDSIIQIKKLDSIKTFLKKDSLRQQSIQKKLDKGLIQPVSDSVTQQQ